MYVTIQPVVHSLCHYLTRVIPYYTCLITEKAKQIFFSLVLQLTNALFFCVEPWYIITYQIHYNAQIYYTVVSLPSECLCLVL